MQLPQKKTANEMPVSIPLSWAAPIIDEIREDIELPPTITVSVTREEYVKLIELVVTAKDDKEQLRKSIFVRLIKAARP